MNCKNHLLGLAAVTLIAFSSCKKDIVSDKVVNADAVSSDAVAANDVPETAAPVGRALNVSMIPNSAGYYEVLPARYSLTTKNYPLILFIHGIGELGTGPGRLICCGIPAQVYKHTMPAEFVVNGQHFSFIVVAPQFKVRPSPSDMQNCIAWAVKHYRVDPTRIYISGLSMGGGSTWDYSAVYGQNVAAAVPVCGGTAPTQALARAIASKNLPVWTISSTNDKVVPISWATNWINWIKASNPANAGNVKLTTYTSGESHNTTWYKAFMATTKMDGLNIYEWMLKYRRTGAGVPTPAPTPGGGTTTPPVTKPPTTTPPPPPPATGTVIANAGGDATIHLFWHFSPLLNATLSKAPGGWLVGGTWTKIGGPAGYKIVNPNALNTRVSFTQTGTYTFRITVKSNKGLTAYDDKVITVLP